MGSLGASHAGKKTIFPKKLQRLGCAVHDTLRVPEHTPILPTVSETSFYRPRGDIALRHADNFGRVNSPPSGYELTKSGLTSGGGRAFYGRLSGLSVPPGYRHWETEWLQAVDIKNTTAFPVTLELGCRKVQRSGFVIWLVTVVLQCVKDWSTTVTKTTMQLDNAVLNA